MMIFDGQAININTLDTHIYFFDIRVCYCLHLIFNSRCFFQKKIVRKTKKILKEIILAKPKKKTQQKILGRKKNKH